MSMENSEIMKQPEIEQGEISEQKEITQKTEQPPSDWEKERTARIDQILSVTKEIDALIFNAGEKGIENIMEVFENIDRFETLAYGKEIGRDIVGEPGMNAITRRTYEGKEGGPGAIAYVKPESGETTFEYDEVADTLFDVRYHPDKKSGKMQKIRRPSKREDAQNIVALFKSRAEVGQLTAERYGITPEELVLHTPEEMTLRYGVEARSTALREYAASRVNELLNWDIVPLTVLRPEEDGQDMASVQEAVPAADPKIPPKTTDADNLEDILDLGAEHPGAKSFMRIACFDYLIKSTDRWNENIIYDEVAEKYYAIDNGLSLGLSLVYKGENQPADPYTSIPMEIVQEHSDWKLDTEAITELQRFHDETTEYLAQLEKGGADETKKDVGIKHLTSIFRLLYDHEKIAKEEALDFFKRINYLLQNGRPPTLQKVKSHVPGQLVDRLNIEEAATSAPRQPKAYAQTEMADSAQ